MRVVHICPNGCSKYTAEIKDSKFRKEVRIRVEDICPVCGSMMEQAFYPDITKNISVFRTRIGT